MPVDLGGRGEVAAVAAEAGPAPSRRATGAPEDAGRPGAAPAAGTPRSPNVALAYLLVALPPLVAVVSVLARGWVPQGDQALEVLRVAEVGTRHTPLVGAYSRWGWDHPGPLLFWWSAPGYRLLGPVGVAVTAGVVNAAAAGAAVVAARRIGGMALAWPGAAATLLLQLSMGDDLVDPWNPYVGVLPLAACLLCAWAGAAGDRPMLAAAVVAGSYSVQAHLGFLPVVAVAALLAAGRAARRRARHRFLPGVALLALALWSGPLLQQVTSSVGNLSALWDYGRTPPEPPVGWSEALRIAGHQFGVPAPWMGAGDADGWGFAAGADPAVALVVVGAAAAVGVAAWRRGDAAAASFVAYALALAASSVWALSRVTGVLAPYLVRWAWPVAGLVWVAAAWAGARLLAPAVRARATAAVAVCCVGLATVGVVGAASVSPPRPADERAVRVLGGDLRAALEPAAAYRMAWFDGTGWAAVATGVAVDLLRHGWDVGVPEVHENAFGRWHTAPDGGRRPTLVVRAHIDRRMWTPPEDARLVAAHDPLTDAGRREARRLERQIRADLGADAPESLALLTDFARASAVLQGADEGDVDRLADLQAAGDAYEVWLVPAR